MGKSHGMYDANGSDYASFSYSTGDGYVYAVCAGDIHTHVRRSTTDSHTSCIANTGGYSCAIIYAIPWGREYLSDTLRTQWHVR
jgi:hypothetical protein